MAASTNATTVFWSTAWTSSHPPGPRAARSPRGGKADGVQRAFVLTADDVAKEVPAYREVRRQAVGKIRRGPPAGPHAVLFRRDRRRGRHVSRLPGAP